MRIRQCRTRGSLLPTRGLAKVFTRTQRNVLGYPVEAMHPSVSEFETRVRRGPSLVRETFALPLPPGLTPWSETSLVFTGIGASEATARTAEQLLRHELRLRVSVQPLSDFLHRDV